MRRNSLIGQIPIDQLANWDGSDELAIVGQRNVARQNRDFVESDRLREELADRRFAIVDKKDGQTEIRKLSDRLFGPSGMGVKNFRFDAVVGATPEGIARTINAALDALQRGDYEDSDMDETDRILDEMVAINQELGLE